MKKNRIHVKNILFCLFLLFLLTFISSCGKFSKFKAELEALEIETVDINSVADGVYTGEVDMKFVSATVSVSVQSGTITAIEVLSHTHGPSKKYGAELIADKVVEAQSLEVDAVSGATGSSKVMRKAIEVALKKGIVNR